MQGYGCWLFEQSSNYKSTGKGGWRDSLAFKSTDCSCRGSVFSAYMSATCYNHLQLQFEWIQHLMPLAFRGTCTHMQMAPSHHHHHTHMNINKNTNLKNIGNTLNVQLQGSGKPVNKLPWLNAGLSETLSLQTPMPQRAGVWRSSLRAFRKALMLFFLFCTEPRASQVLGKCSAPELHSQPCF